MSSRYQRQYTVPDGLPLLLKNFSREILRQQPENIYEFGSRYFADLALEQAEAAKVADVGGRGKKDLAEMSASELGEFILAQFMEYDRDGNGTLDHTEFQAIMSSKALNLSKKDIRKIMAECDENDDGVLEYREFLPIMVQLVHGMKAKKDAEEERNAETKGAKDAVETHLLHGVPREELESMMRSVFRAADVNGDGTLDRREFKRCLKSSDMGFTRREVNILLAEADGNGDGTISYEEFMPLCFSILVERFTDELLTSELQSSSSPDELSTSLAKHFSVEDKDGVGLLSLSQVKAVLTALSRESLGLTRLQILSIMSEADADATGMVKYAKFVPTAARMIHSITDMAHIAQRAVAIEQVSRMHGAQSLRGIDRDTVKQILFEAFQEADADKSGALDRAEVAHVLHVLGNSNLGLTVPEITSLLAAMDVNEDGLVHYAELIDFWFDVLLHLEREAYIRRIAQEKANPQGGEMEGGFEEEEAISLAGSQEDEEMRIVKDVGGEGGGDGEVDMMKRAE